MMMIYFLPGPESGTLKCISVQDLHDYYPLESYDVGHPKVTVMALKHAVLDNCFFFSPEDFMSFVQEWLPALSEEDFTTIGQKLEELGVKCAEHFRYLQESDLDFLAPVQRRILLEKFQTISAAPFSPGQSGSCAKVTSDANSQLDEWAEKFCIPWEMFPSTLLQACKAQERPTKADLNQMVRMLSSLILDKHSAPDRRNLRIIASKVVSMYPSSFQDLLQGTVVGTGVETFMWKLENCINNKKRPIAHVLPAEIVDDPDSFQPRPRSTRDSYGCIAWQPELPSGESLLTQREKQQQLLSDQMKRPKVKKCLEEIEQAKNRLKSVTPEHEGAPVLLLALFDEDEELIYKTVEASLKFLFCCHLAEKCLCMQNSGVHCMRPPIMMTWETCQ
ncbi:hypothetical protein HPB49_003384 [Dermacentor silvarum]|uniref:Uncharacterized protein n=1 Tax=Dermacentor silvarum TaxID=543639 RepID=A0ACB8D2K3_DERSI|nr:hypothetical protein HPB49_003384 [Dermacentor silvarum]